jgi:hypothetical protein
LSAPLPVVAARRAIENTNRGSTESTAFSTKPRLAEPCSGASQNSRAKMTRMVSQTGSGFGHTPGRTVFVVSAFLI